jgi:hypothetical protein
MTDETSRDPPALAAEALSIANDDRPRASQDNQLGLAIVLQVLPEPDPAVPVVLTSTATRPIEVKEAPPPDLNNTCSTGWISMILLLPLVAVLMYFLAGGATSDHDKPPSLRAPTLSPSSSPVLSLVLTTLLRG